MTARRRTIPTADSRRVDANEGPSRAWQGGAERVPGPFEFAQKSPQQQAPADAAPDDTSEVGFWTANYAERLRSIELEVEGIGILRNRLITES